MARRGAIGSGWAAVWLRRAVPGYLIGAVILSPAAAEPRCWPADDVSGVHTARGEEVVLSYHSWMRESSETIIFREPADGVLTVVDVDTTGTACIFDMGQTTSGDAQGGPPPDYLERHPI